MSAPVTVLVSALDEEELLPGALASVAPWAEEILVVVDPRTKDRTRAIAADAGARVLEHPFESSGAQTNWGIERCRTDWVFVLDADERATAGVRDAIRPRSPGPRATRRTRSVASISRSGALFVSGTGAATRSCA